MRRPPLWIWIAAGALLAAAPAGARGPRTVKLRFPRVALPAGTNAELCLFARVRTAEPFDLGSWEIRHRGAGGDVTPLHFLVYAYQGERLSEFAAEAGRVVESRGCLDLGPADRDARQLFATGEGPRSAGALPPGVALRLAPVPASPGGPPAGLGILLDANWVNDGTRTRFVSTRVVLRRAPRRRVRRVALLIAERTAEQGLAVAPGEVGSTEDSTAALNAARPGEPPLGDAWGPGVRGGPAGDACVIALTGRIHERGRFLGVDLLDAAGTPQNPPGGFPNPYEPGRLHLFGALSWTDPGLSRPLPPLLVRAGEVLHYLCWYDNGVETAGRLGCEEVGGTPPGRPAGLPGGGPAKPCTVVRPASPECPATDPAHPGRTFTGACVPAHLVAGQTPDDAACALGGAWFEAVPGAAPGAECDATAAPVLR
jgi:hypothetical protein